MLPNFIVIGAAKCGTTSICDLLGAHPQVFMSTPKEIHYFGRDEAEKTPEWYAAHFAGAADFRAVGEGSTSYTHPDIIDTCASEIRAQIPDCRLIYMVRNPLRRLESDWKMRAQEGWAEGPVSEAVERQPTLVTQSLYWKNLNVYRRLFPAEQIQVLFLEDFAAQPEAELRRCFAHIGVDPDISLADAGQPRNASEAYRRDGLIAGGLRGHPHFEGLKQKAPAWMVKAAKKLLTRRVPVQLEWEPATRARVIDSMAADAAALLGDCGKPADFWRYDV